MPGESENVEAQAEGTATFKQIVITENPAGWGPCTLPQQFADIPYQPFSKADRLGKSADFTGTAFYQGRRDRYAGQYGAGGDMFAYYHDDESSFQLVDTSKAPKPFFQGARRWQQRRNFQRRGESTRGMQQLSKSKNRDRDRMRLEKKLKQRWQGRRRWDKKPDKRTFEPSVDVKPTWRLINDVDFSRLAKLTLKVDEPEDLLVCGRVEYYDKSYDKVSTRNPRRLVNNERTFHKVTTTDDPHIRQFAEKGVGTVFATDSVLAALMSCQRARYSWDLVVRKSNGMLFIDKRDDSSFDYLSVNETANDLPPDEGDHINTPGRLSVEATYINTVFSQQCLKRDQVHTFENPNPFALDEEDVASVAYRYRKWDLHDGVVLVARCEHEAAVKSRQGETSFINVKTLSEWDSKVACTMDWRSKLETQSSAVLATELRNNQAKLARWTVSSLLAGSSYLRLGYVSRRSCIDNSAHEILGTQAYKPTEFAQQINLDMKNCWAILRSFIDIFNKEEDGKFVILKDPNKTSLKVYQVPERTFDENEFDEEEQAEADIMGDLGNLTVGAVKEEDEQAQDGAEAEDEGEAAKEAVKEAVV